MIVANTTAFSISEGTFTSPARNGANHISLFTTPTPHYRLISDGSTWLVYGIGDSVRLAGVQSIAGEKTFTSETNARGLRLSPASGVGESVLGLYYNSDRSTNVDGDAWLTSSSTDGQPRRFAISSRGASSTARLAITPAGLVSIPGQLSVTGQTTCGTLNATALQVAGVDISSTYATQSALTAKQDSLTVISTDQRSPI